MKEISSIDAASSAYGRVRERLFKKIDFVEWMILGFAAWLANLGQNPHIGFGFNIPDFGKLKGENGGASSNPMEFMNKIDPSEIVSRARDFFQSKTFLFIVVLAVLVLFLIAVISIFIVWIKANGKFIFVQNLVMGKTELGTAWSKHSSKSFSFFLGNILFSFISFIVVLLCLVPIVFGVIDLFKGGGANAKNLTMVLGGVFILFIAGVIMAIISFMINWFTVPLMIKKDCGFVQGFLAVWEIVTNNIFHFIGFVLMYIVIQFIFYSAYFLVMFLTCCLCCVGACLLSLPYVWAVVFLPYLAFLRYFSLEFLAQFGDEYNLLPPEQEIADPNLPPA